MSSLARTYQHGRRRLLSHLVQQAKPQNIAKRRFRSITSAVGATGYRRKSDGRSHIPTLLRFVSTTDGDIDESLPLQERHTSERHSRAPLAAIYDDEDGEDDHIPFEDESDDDEDENESQPQIVAEGMFDISKTSALNELNNYYTNDVSAHFRTEFINYQWVATFCCPETGVEYSQGSLRSDEQGAAVEISSIDGSYVHGPPAYRKKNTAIHAAAARVLDIIQYEKLHITEPRLCKEDPALFQKPRLSMQEVHEEEDEANEDGAETKRDNKKQLVSPSPTPAVEQPLELTLPINRIDHDGRLDQILEDVIDDDDDDYSVADIPTPSADSAPSMRLLHAFSSGQHHAQKPTAATNFDSHRMPIAMPIQRLKMAMNIAKSWVQAHSRLADEVAYNPHRMHLPMLPSTKTHLIGKTILEGLAEANQSITIPGLRGCEHSARRVLNIMWKHGDIEPDADAYKCLLHCLEGSSPKAIAEKAESIVLSMRDGQPWSGRVLPKPTTEVINALIQLWAQVGGITGRYENVDPAFEPNRESFLSILSSCCYTPTVPGEVGGLDIAFATECIRRMRELSESNPEDLSLVPDIEVYNAPLRWTGGSRTRQIRPYTRCLPWDKLFVGEDGMRPFDCDDSAVVAAQAVESWIEFMREQGVQPDIVTYEALMQAWLRTDTRIGLDRAQRIAEDLLEPGLYDVSPSLQTFRPLTRSWVFSKENDSTDKIRLLLDRLEGLTTEHPELRPDARLMLTLVSAYRKQLWSNIAKKAPVEDLLEIADKCTLILNALHDRLSTAIVEGEAPDDFLEIFHFYEVEQIWQSVAEICAQGLLTSGSREFFQYALKEWIRVLNMHDDLMQTLMRVESPGGIDLRGRREYSYQLKHLLAQSGTLYSSFMSGMKNIFDLRKRRSTSDEILNILPGQLPLFERIVRRSGEMEIAASHDTELKRDRLGFFDYDTDYGIDPTALAGTGIVEYGDYFPGYKPRPIYSDANVRNVLLRQMLDCLLPHYHAHEVNTGDFARLLLLIKATVKEVSMAQTKGCNFMDVDNMLQQIVGRLDDNTKRNKRQDVYDLKTAKGRRRARSPKIKTPAAKLLSPPAKILRSSKL
ncbi:hypothetical protein MPSEU_000804200 [Mayamaea pseudoterrestris]|nr:hypothetical protein MPSEU_000804200 [Mayamaea pseudoterrestris]